MKIKLTNRSKAQTRKEDDSDCEEDESSERMTGDDWDGIAGTAGRFIILTVFTK